MLSGVDFVMLSGVDSVMLSGVETSVNINISDLESGVYFVKVDKQTKKLIVE